MRYLDWKIGDKIVCVDAAGRWVFHKPLVKNRIYTIREFWEHPATGCIGISLVEIINDIHPGYGMERGYEPSRFRPVQTRNTDISIFEAMLHDKRQKVPAS